MAPRVHGHDLFLVTPLREGADVGRRLSVGEVGSNGEGHSSRPISTGNTVVLVVPMIGIKLLAGKSKSKVDGVGPPMS